MAGRVYYGWWVVLCSIVTLVGTLPGQTVIVSVFIPELQQSLELGPTTLSLAYMTATLTASLPMTAVGRLSDRLGPRRVTLLVSFAMALTCFAMGSVASILTMTVGFVGLRFFGQASMGMLSGHAVALWFEAGLRRVEAVRSAAMGLATTALPPLVHGLVADVGWRWAYPALGAAVLLGVLPLVALVQRDTPESMGLSLEGRKGSEAALLEGATLQEAMSTPTYWVLASLGVLHASFGTALLFHNQALAAAASVDAQTAAWALSGFGGASLVGTTLLFVLGNRLPLRPSLILIPVFLSTACVGVALARGPALYMAAMAVLGLGMALVQASLTPAIALAFGRRHHGSIRGSVMTALVAGTALGPVLLGLSLDLSGSFSTLLLGIPVLALTLGVAVSRVRLTG
ncbi:MAG: MFS transporter [Myxococcota bacterium]